MPLTGTETTRVFNAEDAVADSAVFYPRLPHDNVRFLVNTSGITTLTMSIEGRVDADSAWEEITSITEADLVSGNYVSGLIVNWPQMRLRITAITGTAQTVDAWAWYGA